MSKQTETDTGARKYGPIGRLGYYTATHRRVVAAAWVVIALVMGFLAPRVEHALSGAGWESTGSQSVEARKIIDRDFGGQSSSALMVVVHSETKTAKDPEFASVVSKAQKILKADSRVKSVAPPQEGSSISQDGRIAIIQAGAASDSNTMVRAADDLKEELGKLGANGVDVSLTGASGMWSDFNVANRDAMLKSELISWPVTLVILVLAFGSLVAAGLPLLLTILGLVASAGTLYLATQVLDVSIWAMNFALMFALALGIDYALFIVYRFRAALSHGEHEIPDVVAETMDTAGKAVLFSGLTVLISLTAVMLVPSPAFRSMALGIMISVIFILAATLTLLPTVLAKLGPKIDRLALPWHHKKSEGPNRFVGWAQHLWKHPFAYGAAVLLILLALAYPMLGLKTGMPSIAVVPPDAGSRVGYTKVQEGFGEGAPGAIAVLASAENADRTAKLAAADKGVARVMPPMPGAGKQMMIQVIPKTDASSTATGDTVNRLRQALPAGTLVGGASAENHDLASLLTAKTPLVIGVVLVLGFMLLLVALRAPVIAAVGVVTSLLGTAAAFGVARLIFQDGHLSDFLGFESQGFLDAWGPVFFFAMIFAISMDYTVFLLATAKEHWDRTGDAKEAMVGSLADSGRVIFAAAGVMVAVFFTFALSGPLPPKEMGVILGVAVLLDGFLVRLLLLPVMLRLLGRWAWWLPKPLERLLPDVRFGH